MKEILLTQGQVALVDDEDYDKLNMHKWYAHWIPNTRSFRAQRNSSSKNGESKIIRMHRIVMDAQPGQQVDHRNHNTLDNRRENLRLCTASENQHNLRPHTIRSSVFKGVNWDKPTHKWKARIQLNGHQYHLGRFADETKAACAYDSAARKLFGEFAHLNFQNI